MDIDQICKSRNRDSSGETILTFASVPVPLCEMELSKIDDETTERSILSNTTFKMTVSDDGSVLKRANQWK